MRRRIALLLGLATVYACPAHAASTADIELVGRVAARMFAEVDPIEGWAWPPEVYIVDYRGAGLDEDGDGQVDGDEINADATVLYLKPGAPVEFPDDANMTRVDVPRIKPIEGVPDQDGDVFTPVIRIYQGWLSTIVKGDDAQLANCFGHELAHIMLLHTVDPESGAPLVENAIQRQQESDADVLGFQLAVAAEFSYDELVESLHREREVLEPVSAIESYKYRHPGHSDRVASVAAHEQEIWRSLSAFENGVFFLAHEQYELAEDSFDRVIRVYPKCYEAWANLGYARLMRYTDMLSAEDLQNYDIGQLVIGGFYQRADSIRLRGDEATDLWFQAVGALRQALVLNPDLVLPRAHLAAAFLLHPEGAEPGDAGQEFAHVIRALEAGAVEPGVDDITRAALLVNAGVAEMASGDAAGAEAMFAQARAVFGTQEAFDGSGQVATAIRYNRAVLMARSGDAAQQRSALAELEAYLSSNSSGQMWWSLAFDAYERLCQQQGVPAKPREALASAGNTRLRFVMGVELDGGVAVSLDEPVAQVQEDLGEGLSTNVLGGNPSIRRLRYLDQGLDLLCNDRVLAIRLVGARAPALQMRTSGAGGAAEHDVRVGMNISELEALLGEDATRWDQRSGTTPMIVYRYFTRLGFGVRVNDAGRITEIIVALIPDEADLNVGR